MKRAQPEHRLQMNVKQYLTLCLPPEVEWTANAAGVRVAVTTASKMKAAGVRRGWPDLQFLFPDGVTRYIELKAARADGGAGLSVEQRAFRDRCASLAPAGGPTIWALCRSVSEVADVLRGWGARLRDRPSYTPPEAAA